MELHLAVPKPSYSLTDGTIEFYSRVNALLQPDFRMLDLGAGRGAWQTEETTAESRKLRAFKGRVKEFIGADVDPAVLENPTTDTNIVMQGSRVPLPDHYLDLIVSDYVLEHIVDVDSFVREISRILKPGGYFCARTPHALNYVSFGARMVKNASHSRVLKFIQPDRKPEDVFPTAYRLNSMGDLEINFRGWNNSSYLFTGNPQYYFGKQPIYWLFKAFHSLAPKCLTGNIFVFLRKPE